MTCRVVCVVRRCAYLEVEGGAIPGAGAENEEEKRRVDVEVLVGEVHRDQRQYRVRELNDCEGRGVRRGKCGNKKRFNGKPEREVGGVGTYGRGARAA